MSDDETKTVVSRPRGPDEPPNIPDFTLECSLGRGRFGEVWLARSKSGVYRAIKVLSKGTVTDIEFQGVHTWETHARGHPNLIDVRHVGETPNYFYYVMELADRYPVAETFSPEDYEARTLRAELRRRGRLPLNEAVFILRQVLAGLEHLHKHQLLHRDVKPGNIVFVEGVVKLADIGLVTREERRDYEGRTPAYAPPEGVVDRSGDLYCCGKMFFEMVTGTAPQRFPELPSDAELLQQEPFKRILPMFDRACAPEREERFQTPDEFVAALDEVVGRPEDVTPPARTTKRGRWLVAATVVGLIAIALIIINSPFQVSMKSGDFEASFSIMREIQSVYAQSDARSTEATSKDRAFPQQDEDSHAPLTAMASTGRLEILYKRSQHASDHFVLTAQELPLRTGELVKVRVTLSEPSYPVVALLTKDAGVQIAYPTNAVTQMPVQQLLLPPDDRWWQLQPPDGTLTFVLLATDHPVGDLDYVIQRLGSFGSLPTVAADTLLVLQVDGRIERIRGLPSRSRGIDVTRTLESVPGPFEQLSRVFGNSYRTIYALAVPQVTGGTASRLGTPP